MLRYVTQKRGKTCLLEDALLSFGKKGLNLKQRLSFAAPHAFAALIAKLAGAGSDLVRDKISVHGSRVRALVNTCRSVGEYGLTLPQTFSAPLMVVWNFTQACNYNCKHCYQDAHRRLEDELTLAEKFALAETLAYHDVCMIAFSGGEPLMGEGFYETAGYAHNLGLHLTVATNGSLLTPESCRRLLDVGIKYAEISLDSLDPDKHDHFRGGRGYWRRTVQGIRNAVATPGLRTGVAMTVTKLNFAELEDMIRWSIDEGADVFYAFNFIPTGRGKAIAELDITPDQREQMLRQRLEYLIQEQSALADESRLFYAGKEDLTDTSTARFLRAEKRQRRVTPALDAVIAGLAQIRNEAYNNRLEMKPSPLVKRLDEQILAPLGAVTATLLPEITGRVAAARECTDQTKRDSAWRDAETAQQHTVAYSRRARLVA